MTYAPMAPPVSAAPPLEARREFIVRAVLFIYILSLIEGPLRKWFLPGLAGPLTLLRDPFVIALYAYAFLHGLMLRRGIAAVWLGFAAFTSCFGAFQYAMSGFGPDAWLLGVRTYWLYMPLAFVVAKTFHQEDVLRFLRLNLWIALPYALLVATQYNAGAWAFINRGVGGDEAAAVGVSDGILRPFGLFTYTGPNVQFTAAMIAMFTALFLAGRGARPALPVFLAMAASVAAMSVLTGSRVIYFQAAIVVGGTMLGMLAARPNRATLMRILGLAAFVGLAALLFVQVFPDMLAAMESRFESAQRSEGSLWNRIYYSFFSFIDAFAVAPVLGHGIGAGASGVANFIGLSPLIFGEADTQRNVNELGVVLGAFFLLLRWWFAIWLVMVSVALARKGIPSALPLAGLAVFDIGAQSITNSPLLAFYTWIIVGLIMALRIPRRI